MREAGVPVLEAPARPDRGRPAAAREGVAPAAAAAACGSSATSPTLAAEIATRRGRGGVRVRRRHRLRRAVRRARPPRRGAGRRRPARRRARARRARLLDPAPPPEGGRGGARAPASPRGPRAALHDAARAAAAAIGYVGAGTVEFLYDPETERFFFLEMNTRLQVEHPVTEVVLGVDLVALQLAVAEGGARWPTSGARHRDPRRARDRGPALRRGPGRRLPAAERRAHPRSRSRPGRRASGSTPGFESGSEVSTHYDAMLAKVIAHAPTRERRPGGWPAPWHGPGSTGSRTNRDLLVAILRDPDFLAGEVGTALPRRALRGSAPARDRDRRSGTCGRRGPRARRDRRAARAVQHGIPVAGATSTQPAAAHRVRAATTVGRVVRRAATATPSTGSTWSRPARRRGDAGRRTASPTTYAVRGRPATAVEVDGPAGTPGWPGARGSPTRPTRSRAAACWRRCPARS